VLFVVPWTVSVLFGPQWTAVLAIMPPASHLLNISVAPGR
jgi:hypothetical protein